MSKDETWNCPSCEEDVRPISLSISPEMIVVRCPMCRETAEISQDTGVPLERDAE